MMTGLPDYSVLMSVYRNDKTEYLDTAIRSMVNQTVSFADFVIVCDGPIGEELTNCLEEWKAELGDRLTVLRLSCNQGLGKALSEGLPLCNCDVVARMDADDISRPNRCELLLMKMVEDNLDLVGGAIEEFLETPGDLGAVRCPPLDQNGIVSYAKARNPFNHVSVMFRRQAVQKAGGYKSFAYMEDYYLWVRMIMQGAACGNISNVIVDVRTGDGMYLRRSNSAYLKSQKAFFKELLSMGFIRKPSYALTMTARTVATALPGGAVKCVYNKVLRKRGGGL